MAHLLAAAALLEQASGGTAQAQVRSTTVAAFWVRRRLLGDPCAGEGAAAFDEVVDGHTG